MDRKKNTFSRTILIWIYLLVSVAGIFSIAHIYNGMISRHDKVLTMNISNLIAEKVNRSVEYMQQSVDKMAMVLSYQELVDPEHVYEQLAASVQEADYISAGIISSDGKVYARPTEKEELGKWGLVSLASHVEKVSISEPYRSALTGKQVFTMFSPIYQKGQRWGCLFVTYPLSEIQNIANTNIMQDEADIYLMNARSNNTILCSGSNPYLIGNWSSEHLMKQHVSVLTLPAYEQWTAQMRNGEKKGSVQFELDGISYVQVFEQIDAMDGWNVVVRIPNSILSNTAKEFQKLTMALALLLMCLSLMLFRILHKQDMEEKKQFEYLSTHDALTGIYNRRAFEQEALQHLSRKGELEQGALIFMDVDYFKQINDRFGHDAGDLALVSVADGLKRVLGDEAIISRYGGDEFVILVKRVPEREALNQKMEQLKKEFYQIVLTKDTDVDFHVQFSAGIVAFPQYGVQYDTLTRCADQAVYQVKENGRNGYAWYDAAPETGY